MTASVWAVVVARTGPSAKKRLSTVLGPEERAALAEEMLREVLAACRGAGLATVAVVSTDDGARAARGLGVGAIVVEPAGMNQAVATGLGWVAGRGAAATLVLPGDVPLTEADDLRAIVAAGEAEPCVVVVPDRRGEGTNALFLRPTDAIAPAFEGASAARHLRLAEHRGARAVRLDLPRVALDVDTPEDLVELARASRGRVPAGTCRPAGQ